MRDDILGRWPDATRLLDELIDLDEETRARRVAEIGARDPALVPLLSALATETSALEARFRPVATSLSADPWDGDRFPIRSGPIASWVSSVAAGWPACSWRSAPISASAPRVALKAARHDALLAGAAATLRAGVPDAGAPPTPAYRALARRRRDHGRSAVPGDGARRRTADRSALRRRVALD